MPRPTLKLANGRVPVGRAVTGAALRGGVRASFSGATPGKISRILKAVEQGTVHDWADLAQHMLRHDSHIASVYNTRVLAVAGSDIVVEPGIARPGEEDIAEQAAEDCRLMIESTPQLERVISDLLHAEGIGWAVAEHAWTRRDGRWVTAPVTVLARDVRFASDWTVEVRSYDEGGERWISTGEEPDRWVIHLAGGVGETPNLSGDLLSVAWPFVFKRWGEAFWSNGVEKLGNGILIGKMKENAPPEAREALKEALDNLSGDQSGVMEQGTDIEVVFPNFKGEAFSTFTSYWNDAISKSLLGSTLNVEVGSSGGNRSLGESQFDTTILPRLASHAKRLSTTLERQWLRPYLKFNAASYGGRTPPTPRVSFKLLSDDPAQVDELAVKGGNVTVNELRKSRGLPEIESAKGGEDVVSIADAPAEPEFDRDPEVSTPRPLSSRPRKAPKPQMSLPLMSKTSATGSRSTTQAANVPTDLWDGLES